MEKAANITKEYMRGNEEATNRNDKAKKLVK